MILKPKKIFTITFLRWFLLKLYLIPNIKKQEINLIYSTKAYNQYNKLPYIAKYLAKLLRKYVDIVLNISPSV